MREQTLHLTTAPPSVNGLRRTAHRTLRSPHRLMRGAAVVLAFAALAATFSFVLRPWMLHWGATAAELSMPLPGDEVVPAAISQETRAITIHAPVDKVWPWLAQLGQDRGGFYSYDLLENLVGCRMPTDDYLRPDKQQWTPGDKLWMYPATKGGGVGYATLRVVLPGRALAFGTHVGDGTTGRDNGSWALVLQPVDSASTRLITRGRSAASPSGFGPFVDLSMFEPMHFVMEKRMMIGIDQLATGQSRGRAWNHVQVVLWVVTFVMFWVGLVWIFFGPVWHRKFAGTLAAAIVFQILTLGQPPVDVGIVLVLVVAAILWWPVEPGSPLSHVPPASAE